MPCCIRSSLLLTNERDDASGKHNLSSPTPLQTLAPFFVVFVAAHAIRKSMSVQSSGNLIMLRNSGFGWRLEGVQEKSALQHILDMGGNYDSLQ